MSQLEVLFWNLFGRTEENHESPRLLCFGRGANRLLPDYKTGMLPLDQFAGPLDAKIAC